MYLCVRGINFASLYDFDISFGIVPTVFFHFINTNKKYTNKSKKVHNFYDYCKCFPQLSIIENPLFAYKPSEADCRLTCRDFIKTCEIYIIQVVLPI